MIHNSVEQSTNAGKSLLVSEALWCVVNGLLRVAAALCIIKFFGVKSHVRKAGIALAVTSAALSLVGILEIFLVCRPFAAQWDPHVLGTCGDQILSFTILESAGLMLDLCTLLLPVLLVWGLQMQRRKRIPLILILDAGIM